MVVVRVIVTKRITILLLKSYHTPKILFLS